MHLTGPRRPRPAAVLACTLALAALGAGAAWLFTPEGTAFRYSHTPLLSLKRRTDRHPEDRLAWREMGLRLARAGDYAMAERSLRPAHAQDPRDPDVAAALGEVLLNTGQVPEAFQLLRSVAESHPEFVPGRMLLGRLYRQRGSYHNAAAQFEAVTRLRESPVRGEAHYELTRCYLQMQQVAKATEAAREAIRADPRDPRYHAVLGAAMAAVGQIDEAVESVRKAAALAREDPGTQAGFASLLLAHHRSDADLALAQQTLERLESLRRDHPQLPFLKGKLALLRADWNAAAAYLEESRRLTPQQDEVYFALSQAYSRLGRSAESTESLGVYRRRQELRRRIDEVLIKMSNVEKKGPYYRRLAALQVQAGELEEARNSLLAALQEAPQDEALRRELQSLERLAAGGQPERGGQGGQGGQAEPAGP